MRLSSNTSLKMLIMPHLKRPVGRPPRGGVQVCLAYNLLHMIRDIAFRGESVKPSIDSIIRRLVKVGARVCTMHEGGMSMLRRLFPLPDTIVSCSPDAHRVRLRNESTNNKEVVRP